MKQKTPIDEPLTNYSSDNSVILDVVSSHQNVKLEVKIKLLDVKQKKPFNEPLTGHSSDVNN